MPTAKLAESQFRFLRTDDAFIHAARKWIALNMRSRFRYQQVGKVLPHSYIAGCTQWPDIKTDGAFIHAVLKWIALNWRSRFNGLWTASSRLRHTDSTSNGGDCSPQSRHCPHICQACPSWSQQPDDTASERANLCCSVSSVLLSSPQLHSLNLLHLLLPGVASIFITFSTSRA